MSELIVFFKPISLSEKLNIFKNNHPQFVYLALVKSSEFMIF